ncbi:MAG: hypothetical protein ACXADY_25265 [Candidatus Hodarchaeales archaeon]|jgi:hypothetical protein
MPLDLYSFYQKLQVYPETYFLPEEDQALTILLETLEGLFGETISQLPQALRLQLARDVVHACVSVSHR